MGEPVARNRAGTKDDMLDLEVLFDTLIATLLLTGAEQPRAVTDAESALVYARQLRFMAEQMGRRY